MISRVDRGWNRGAPPRGKRLAPPVGLPGRPWYRHAVYAPDSDTGYGAKTLPGVREAVERGDWEEARVEAERLTGVIENYAARVDLAAGLLETATQRQEPTTQDPRGSEP